MSDDDDIDYGITDRQEIKLGSYTFIVTSYSNNRGHWFSIEVLDSNGEPVPYMHADEREVVWPDPEFG